MVSNRFVFNPCDDDPNGQKPPSVDDSLSCWLQYPNTMQLEQLLVGGLEHLFFIIPYIGNNNPNTDFHIFQRGRYTTNQIMYCILPSKWPSKEYHGDAVYSMNMGPSQGCFQVEHRWHHHPTTTSPVQRFYDGISVLLPWSFSSCTDWVATHHH